MIEGMPIVAKKEDCSSHKQCEECILLLAIKFYRYIVHKAS